MKCKDCSACRKGFFKSDPESYVCIGVKEPFIVDNIDHACTEYPEKNKDTREEDRIKKLIQFIEESNNIVFFGGAGVSTESGIPDFRSKDGLYNQHDVLFEKYEPEYLLSRYCLYNNPKVFYEFYRQKMDARKVSPNIAHKTLAKLEEIGKLKAIVTQNIDGLHQKAGSKNVYEIHGSTQRNYCHKCHMGYQSDFLFDTNQAIPKCECGGLIRPDVTLYGEDLPKGAVADAVKAIEEADLLIVAGTSLQVYPAANLINHFFGEHLVVINKEEVQIPLFDKKRDLFIFDSIGKVFGQINDYLKLSNN